MEEYTHLKHYMYACYDDCSSPGVRCIVLFYPLHRLLICRLAWSLGAHVITPRRLGPSTVLLWREAGRSFDYRAPGNYSSRARCSVSNFRMKNMCRKVPENIQLCFGFPFYRSKITSWILVNSKKRRKKRKNKKTSTVHTGTVARGANIS